MSSPNLTSKRAEWMNTTIQDSLNCKDTVWDECIADPSNA